MSAHAAHPDPGAHDDHAFDGEPAQALSPDEQPTPMWLPAVGAALFVVAAVWFLAISKDEPASELDCSGNSRPRRISAKAGRQQVAGIYCRNGKRSSYPPAAKRETTPADRRRGPKASELVVGEAVSI